MSRNKEVLRWTIIWNFCDWGRYGLVTFPRINLSGRRDYLLLSHKYLDWSFRTRGRILRRGRLRPDRNTKRFWSFWVRWGHEYIKGFYIGPPTPFLCSLLRPRTIVSHLKVFSPSLRKTSVEGRLRQGQLDADKRFRNITGEIPRIF